MEQYVRLLAFSLSARSKQSSTSVRFREALGYGLIAAQTEPMFPGAVSSARACFEPGVPGAEPAASMLICHRKLVPEP